MPRTNGYDGVYIVGAGQAAYEKRSDRPVHRVLWEAFDGALGSAGLAMRDVDGLAATAFVLPPDNVTTLAEHFGLAPRWLFHGLYGGASGVISVLHAARAIQAGDADVVACISADVFDTAAHDDMLDHFNGSVRDYMAPFGFGGVNGTFALHTRLYMEKHGATRADFGRLCVAQRDNALLNPNALFNKPLTLDEYLNARVISEPLRLFDCVHPCTGGDAVILAHEKVAERLDVPLVRILGGGEQHNYPPDDICGDLDWVEASGKGRVASRTLVHRPHHAGFGPEAPYVFLAVALAEGPLMYSRLAGTLPPDLVGRSVRAVFVDHGPDRKMPFFEIDDG